MKNINKYIITAVLMLGLILTITGCNNKKDLNVKTQIAIDYLEYSNNSIKSKNAIKTLDYNHYLFPSGREDYEGYVDWDLTYYDLTNNIKSAGDRLISLNAFVFKVGAVTTLTGDGVSALLAVDKNMNLYGILYYENLDHVKDYLEGSFVQVYGLPIGTSETMTDDGEIVTELHIVAANIIPES